MVHNTKKRLSYFFNKNIYAYLYDERMNEQTIKNIYRIIFDPSNNEKAWKYAKAVTKQKCLQNVQSKFDLLFNIAVNQHLVALPRTVDDDILEYLRYLDENKEDEYPSVPHDFLKTTEMETFVIHNLLTGRGIELHNLIVIPYLVKSLRPEDLFGITTQFIITNDDLILARIPVLLNVKGLPYKTKAKPEDAIVWGSWLDAILAIKLCSVYVELMDRNTYPGWLHPLYIVSSNCIFLLASVYVFFFTVEASTFDKPDYQKAFPIVNLYTNYIAKIARRLRFRLAGDFMLEQAPGARLLELIEFANDYVQHHKEIEIGKRVFAIDMIIMELCYHDYVPTMFVADNNFYKYEVVIADLFPFVYQQVARRYIQDKQKADEILVDYTRQNLALEIQLTIKQMMPQTYVNAYIGAQRMTSGAFQDTSRGISQAKMTPITSENHVFQKRISSLYQQEMKIHAAHASGEMKVEDVADKLAHIRKKIWHVQTAYTAGKRGADDLEAGGSDSKKTKPSVLDESDSDSDSDDLAFRKVKVTPARLVEWEKKRKESAKEYKIIMEKRRKEFEEWQRKEEEREERDYKELDAKIARNEFLQEREERTKLRTNFGYNVLVCGYNHKVKLHDDDREVFNSTNAMYPMELFLNYGLGAENQRPRTKVILLFKMVPVREKHWRDKAWTPDISERYNRMGFDSEFLPELNSMIRAKLQWDEQENARSPESRLFKNGALSRVVNLYLDENTLELTDQPTTMKIKVSYFRPSHLVAVTHDMYFEELDDFRDIMCPIYMDKDEVIQRKRGAPPSKVLNSITTQVIMRALHGEKSRGSPVKRLFTISTNIPNNIIRSLRNFARAGKLILVQPKEANLHFVGSDTIQVFEAFRDVDKLLISSTEVQNPEEMLRQTFNKYGGDDSTVVVMPHESTSYYSASAEEDDWARYMQFFAKWYRAERNLNAQIGMRQSDQGDTDSSESDEFSFRKRPFRHRDKQALDIEFEKEDAERRIENMLQDDTLKDWHRSIITERGDIDSMQNTYIAGPCMLVDGLQSNENSNVMPRVNADFFLHVYPGELDMDSLNPTNKLVSGTSNSLATILRATLIFISELQQKPGFENIRNIVFPIYHAMGSPIKNTIEKIANMLSQMSSYEFPNGIEIRFVSLKSKIKLPPMPLSLSSFSRLQLRDSLLELKKAITIDGNRTLVLSHFKTIFSNTAILSYTKHVEETRFVSLDVTAVTIYPDKIVFGRELSFFYNLDFEFIRSGNFLLLFPKRY